MIRFVTLGTNDLKKSSNFYDEILKILGIIRIDLEEERYVGYAKEKKAKLAYFYIMTPFNKDKASIGNGTMVSFDAQTPEKVNEIHKKALELGAINEGDPGPRHGENYYAYLRDLDGNKICMFAET
ncbi:VOC family protein [Alphaproteobacteria bacterium]|nr:VOC family protein [Alphaproteobacteria bacterium]